jgi:hypothetical protein
MLRRKRRIATGPPDQSAAVFHGLRDQVIALDPSSVGLIASKDLPHVFGVVMDTSYPNGSATLVAISDGTTSLYTSTGGGVIGGGAHAHVVQANRSLLLEAEARLSDFARSAGDAPTLPPAGYVNITLLTYSGLRRITAPQDDLGEGRHLASSVFHAAHGVITELRLTETGSTDPPISPSPGGATPLMAAAHRGTWRRSRASSTKGSSSSTRTTMATRH